MKIRKDDEIVEKLGEDFFKVNPRYHDPDYNPDFTYSLGPQKKDNNYWNQDKVNKNYKKSNKLILWIFAICIMCAIMYYVKNKDNPIITPEADKQNINLIDTNINLTSNKNGKIMAESVKTINNIIAFKTIGSSEEELLQHIETIKKVDLSVEYSDYKAKMIQKINYYIEYLNDRTDENLEKYNSINHINELSIAFDKAGVQYEITNEGKLQYWYY